MEDIKIDSKFIIFIISISIVIGIVIWFGYNFLASHINDENEGIENFEGDMTSQIDTLEREENNKIDEEISLITDPQKLFQINNDNPSKGLKDWATVKVNHDEAGHSVQYSIPGSSEKLQGRYIYSGVLDMSYWGEQPTYEDYIEDFMGVLKSRDNLNDKGYKTRKININGKQYYVVMKDTDYIVASYFCLAKEGYSYHLGIIVDKRYYDNSLQNTIDKIFSTYTIL